jgi:zinc protease
MRKSSFFAAYAVVIAGLCAAGYRGLEAADLQAADIPKLTFEKYTLPNGLEVILSQDRRLPLVAVNLWYHVGPAIEDPGRTGFAHLFEHMMFQGSKHVPADAHFKLLEGAGASEINGTTDFDRTNYFQTVPSNQLPLALWLESDRMGYLLEKLDQQSLSNQQDVVRNERRQGLENVPYGIVDERLFHTIFPKGHPYYASVIGSHEDLQAVKLEDVRNFFKQFYSPNNASLVIVGDFEVAETKGLVEKYFGTLKRGPAVAKPNVATPPITSERRVTVTDTVELPKVYISWLTPKIFEPGDATAMVTAALFGGGKSSRLFKKLVYEKQMAQTVAARQQPLILGSVFGIEALARPGHTAEAIEQAIDDEIRKLQSEGPTPEEVERARNGIEAEIIQGLERLGGFGGVADRLNMYNHYLGNPDYLAQDITRIRQVTPQDVKAFATQYLAKSSRVVVFGIPGKKDAPPDPPAAVAPASAAAPKEMEGINQPELWRAQTPAPMATRALKLPTPTRFTLPNGLTVLLVEQHDLPVVAANLVIRTGSGANPPDVPGLANFTAGMLDEGTKTRNALAIADEAAKLGATVGTQSTMDSTTVVVRSLKKTFRQALALAADVALNPSFPPEEIERQRKSRLAALVQERDNPAAVAQRVMNAALYGAKHPYGYTETGTEGSNTAITREQMLSFWKQNFVANNAALVVAGDVTESEIKALAQEVFGGWPQGTAAAGTMPTPEPTRGRLVIVDKPGAPQTELRVAKVGVARDTPDYFPLQVMNTTLGGQFSSRLNMNLREDKGYTYGSYSGFAFRRSAGPFLAVAGVRGDATAPSVAEIIKEIRRMAEAPPSPEELTLAKDSLIRSLPGDFESTATIAANLQALYVYDLGLDYFAKYPERVAAVDAASAQRVARTHLVPERLIVIAVGDRAKIQPELEKPELQLGKAEIRQPDGSLAAAGSQ